MARTGINIRITGLDETIQNFRQISRGIIPVLSATLNQEHEIIMTLAKERTPVDTGSLRSSGVVFPIKLIRRSIISKGGFGGSAAPYAAIVHERLDVRHTVGRAKYYESAVRDRKGKVKDAVRLAIRNYLESRARR